MRPSTDQSPPAGYGRFVGRVGALAIFLGVGTALGMPAASADTDDAAPSRAASTSAASSVSDSSRGPTARSARTTVRASVNGARLPTAPTRPVAAVTPRRAPTPGAASTAPQIAASTAPQVAASTAAQTELSNRVSPLGTPAQISRERIAMRTANTLPVNLMKFVLRQGFLAAANQQFADVGGPDQANLDRLNNAVDEYALASAFSQQILNPMDPAVVTQVAPPHDWYGLSVGGSRLLYDNPDTIYRFIPVNKTSEYVLTGRLYEGIPADTTFSVLEGTSGVTSTILTLDDLDVSPDGSFVITVSGAAATPGQKNHLQLTSSSTLIAARNTLGDWAVEEPMELEVQRVSGPPNSLFAQLGGFVLLGSLVNDNPLLASLASLIPPLAIAEAPIVRGTLTALLMIVRGSNQEAKYMALATTDPATGDLRPPNVMTPPASNAEFLANQLQSNGYFQLADDEALILTIDPASAGFFTVPVYDDWTITGDYWNEQTSLNNDQSVANGDGTYTMVVSPTDPLVRNWVSTGGLNQGIISMRFQNLDPEAPGTPTVASQVVKISDLADYLPAGTELVTPEQRAAQLAVRKKGFNKRWAPYLQS
jgi:hypothetical protein